MAFGDSWSGVQAHTIHGSVYVGTERDAKQTQAGLENPLSRLPYAQDAPFNSYAKQHEPACLPNTRLDLLREIHSWAD
ncbi:hypothetical protein PTT_19615 [Pyrenophora teres f. teres 0-1]|uniref:Uncharacterized protein n=1 Tax=Pyrenophora teres f. teres (strain 0-1) TaxID=861557 RepID=E3S9B5_PYRTT|nr:hypothetical protein PTT_19615 [Pyrenophora teres f. teres 0-1]